MTELEIISAAMDRIMSAQCGRCKAPCPADEAWCKSCQEDQDMAKYEEREDLERAFPKSEYE